jgi:hypothetical protein
MSENTTFAGFGSPNYTQVPDELFDQLMPDLSGAELKVLLYIIRRTFGFKKNSDPISFNQFLDGIKGKDGKILDRGCGIKSRDKLNNALKSLLSKGIITAEKRADTKGGKQTTVYSLRFRTEVSSQEASTETVLGGSPQKGPGVVPKRDLQETVKQETENLSSIRDESSQKNEKTDEPEQGRPEPLAAQPTVSYEEFVQLQQAHQQQPPEESREEVNPAPQPAGLTRQYLRTARTRATQQFTAYGLASIASVLPKPAPAKRTYSEERQVLVDVIADLAREFRDEAQLTESVSRAYNLMQDAKISDIGVFTSKIYEARSITKEHYGTIKRRMPYFFSVLADVCGLRPKTPQQNPPSG